MGHRRMNADAGRRLPEEGATFGLVRPRTPREATTVVGRHPHSRASTEDRPLPLDDASPGFRKGKEPPRRRATSGRWVAILFVLLWGAMMIVPPLVLVANRQAWLASLEAPVAQEDWEVFRRAMRAESGAEGPVGPVLRKVPKSAEPPLRVWLRDYLALAIVAWMVLGGTLGGFLGMMIVGASGNRDASNGRRAEDG